MTGSALWPVQQVELGGYRLDDKDGLDRLLRTLSAGGSFDCAEPLVEHVLQLGAIYVVIEAPYTDQDYSADFVSFYAAAFKTYPRFTKRLHFFGRDVSELLELSIGEQAKAFSAEETYLGFTVVRPLNQGPIGRTVLRFPSLEDGLTVRGAVRAKSRVHLLAAELQVQGAPFIQQDSRVGACAQASIWMASRPLFERHARSGWHPMSEITRLAVTPTDPEVSSALPHGSSGLSPIHIIRALRAMGHQPYTASFIADEQDGAATAEDDADDVRDAVAQAKDAPLSEAGEDGLISVTSASPTITRYLDSGLPVIIGLAKISSKRKEGHAVTAVGYVEVEGGAVRDGEGYDAFLRAFIVHDDQRGPYRLMPLTASDVDQLPPERILRIDGQVVVADEKVTHIFVPLSPRVFLTSDKADWLAWDFVRQHVQAISRGERADQVAKLGQESTDQLQKFLDAWTERRLVRRTFLTTAGRYRHHLAKTELEDQVKLLAVARKLPHFIWVTELLYADTPQDPPGGERKIVGHVVMNATSSTDLDGDLLFAHVPFFVLQRDIDPPEGYGEEYIERGTVIGTHTPYAQRVKR